MTDDRDAARESAEVALTNRDPDDPRAEPATEPTAEGGRRYTRGSVSRRPLGCLIEVAETLILTIVIFFLIQTFVAQPFQVQQESMHGTLEEGQYVLVDKLTPHFDNYSRGDIVVFHPVTHEGSCSSPPDVVPLGDETPFIKRVLGEPGDLVELQDGEVFVNGVQVDEPYIHGALTTELGNESSWTVPDDRLFVMGDNRMHSSDSRAFGPICIGDVVGRAWLRYWPINTLGILQTPTYPNVPPSTAARTPATP
jgi:signal peptidase I